MSGRISSQVKEAIGYASAPGASVIDTRKSVSGRSFAPAAAAVADSSDGVHEVAGAVLERAYGRLFAIA